MQKPLYLKNVTTLVFNAERCVGCGMCTQVCPHEVFVLEAKKARLIDADSCMECGACAMNCPAGAIEVEAGVGCAAAVIASAFRKDGSVCC